MAGPMFQYSSVYVKISEAKKLPSREMSSMRDPFCVLKVDNETVARTAQVFKSLDPFWGEEFTLHVPNEFQDITVYMYDYDTVGSKEPLGKVMLGRETTVRSPRGIDRWFPLTPISKDDEVQGEILVDMSIEAYSEDAFRLLITLVEARDLAAKGDHGKADPFAVIYYNKKQYSTQVASKTRFPRWKKTFDLILPMPLSDPSHKHLQVVVYDKDKFGHNHFMGQVEVDLNDLQLGQRYKTWYRLQHHEPKEKDKKKELGSLRLKVQCHEERILDSQFYQRFVALMLKAVEDPKPEGSPLLIMLEDVMTMDRNALAHTLVRFYLAYGSVLPLLDTLTYREIFQTTVPSTLFRGNSLASKSFDQFMKIAALPYLHETMKPAIDRVYTERKVCELDPEQIKMSNSKSRAGNSSLAAVQKVQEMTVLTLTNYLNTVTEAIFSSVDKSPPLLRMALRQLWLRVADHFQGLENADVPYLAITGFLFLRFFAPSILAPKLFALREEHPDHKIEKTLKFMAKVIQSMGNLQTEFGAKEQFMEPMFPFILVGVSKVKTFIEELVQIDQKKLTAEVVAKDGGYIHHLVLCCGFLWKKSSFTTSSSFSSSSSSSSLTSGGGGMGHLQFRRRFFELSNISLTYASNEKKMGDVKSYPVPWIKVVEKLDESAFHRKHMFQVVVVPSGPTLLPDMPSQITLYLQAADVNEQNRWVSVIRKACLTNREMSPVYHPGIFRKTKWSCCRTTANQEPGCSQCHRGITISDWRDPLDPDLDAQIIFSQFHKNRSALVKKYAPSGDDGSGSISRDGSISPTSLTSAGTGMGSLQTEEEGGGGANSLDATLESSCHELLSTVDELWWQHSTVHTT